MFADSLYDSAWANRPRRGCTTLISFAVQTLGLTLLLSLPLLYTQGLPHLQWMAPLVAPAAPLSPSTRPARAAHQSTSNLSSEGKVIAPRFVPKDIPQINDTTAPPPVDVSGLQVLGGTGDPRAKNPVFDSIGNGLNNIALPPPASPPALRVSHVMEGNLIHRVQPEYPSLARQAGIQGTVLLRAVINREGRIENLQVLSGHPMLVQAALDAVRQWRYRPYYLNSEAVEVETRVTVNFTLAGRY